MICSIMNLKGGVGKTTTAMGLATAASRDGRQVRVVDADPQASASMWAYVAESNGEALPFRVEPANRVLLQTMRVADGEWAFVDCPPSGDVLDSAKRASDLVIVPLTPGLADWQQALAITDALMESRVPFRVLITLAEASRVMYREIVHAIEKLEMPVFRTEIPRREAVRTAFYHPFPEKLYGYGGLWGELKALEARG